MRPRIDQLTDTSFLLFCPSPPPLPLQSSPLPILLSLPITIIESYLTRSVFHTPSPLPFASNRLIPSPFAAQNIQRHPPPLLLLSHRLRHPFRRLNPPERIPPPRPPSINVQPLAHGVAGYFLRQRRERSEGRWSVLHLAPSGIWWAGVGGKGKVAWLGGRDGVDGSVCWVSSCTGLTRRLIFLLVLTADLSVLRLCLFALLGLRWK